MNTHTKIKDSKHTFLKIFTFKKCEKSHNSKKRLGWTTDFAMLLSLVCFITLGLVLKYCRPELNSLHSQG